MITSFKISSPRRTNAPNDTTIKLIVQQLPFWLLAILSNAVTITFRFKYSRILPNNSFFLLFYVRILTMCFGIFMFLFYESTTMYISQLRYLLVSIKKGVLTPFFFLGILLTINVILITAANNKGITIAEQILASLLQFPFALIFNRCLNNMYCWNKNKNITKQLCGWFALFVCVASVILLLMVGRASNISSRFVVYLLGQLVLPLIAIIYQFIFSNSWWQADLKVYSKPSLLIAIVSLWQIVCLLFLIMPILTLADNNNPHNSMSDLISDGFVCIFEGNATTINTNQNIFPETCKHAFAVLTILTFANICNFYASMKISTFIDAAGVVLIQQYFGPTMAYTMFFNSIFLNIDAHDVNSKTFDGVRIPFSIIFLLIAFFFYTLLRKYIGESHEDEIESFLTTLWVEAEYDDTESDYGYLKAQSQGLQYNNQSILSDDGRISRSSTPNSQIREYA